MALMGVPLVPLRPYVMQVTNNGSVLLSKVKYEIGIVIL